MIMNDYIKSASLLFIVIMAEIIIMILLLNIESSIMNHNTETTENRSYCAALACIYVWVALWLRKN